MFNKLKSSKLALVFLILLAIVITILLFDIGKRESTFDNKLISLDSAKVNAITIYPKNNKTKPIKLEKTENTWVLKYDGNTYEADTANIAMMLKELKEVTAARLVAQTKAQWKEYEVDDSLGIRVQIEQKNKIVADFVVGKFTYKAPENPYSQQFVMASHIRMTDKEEVYVVSKFLNMLFNSDVKYYKNKIIAKLEPSAVQKIQFTHPADSSFILEKRKGKWYLGMEEADSTQVNTYLASFNPLISYDIIDTTIQSNPSHGLQISMENSPKIAIINAFKADSLNQYLISGNINANTYFSGNKGNLFNRIFPGKSKFVKK